MGHRWLAGTHLRGGVEEDLLIDDGQWRTYTILFTLFEPGPYYSGVPSNDTIRVMLEDDIGSGGVAGDALFDNVTLRVTMAPTPTTTPTPAPMPVLVSSRIQANGKDLQITDVKTAALSTSVVDWNNDGKEDLLLGAYWPSYIYLYLNSGTNDSPVFSMGERLQVEGRDLRGSMGANPFVTDWNNDGKKDIVLGGWNGIFVYLNGGTDDHPELQAGFPILSKSTGNNVGLGTYSHPFIVDWDNDGRKDLLNGHGRYLSLWLNSGTDDSPLFSESTRLKFGGLETSGSSLAPYVVDFDGDGRKDLVVRDSRGFYWYRNVGDDSAPIFATKVAIKSGGTQLTIYGGDGSALFSIADWDDDGVNDLIAGDYKGYVHVIWRVAAGENIPTPVK